MSEYSVDIDSLVEAIEESGIDRNAAEERATMLLEG
jgi:hypothetical protein